MGEDLPSRRGQGNITSCDDVLLRCPALASRLCLPASLIYESLLVRLIPKHPFNRRSLFPSHLKLVTETKEFRPKSCDVRSTYTYFSHQVTKPRTSVTKMLPASNRLCLIAHMTVSVSHVSYVFGPPALTGVKSRTSGRGGPDLSPTQSTTHLRLRRRLSLSSLAIRLVYNRTFG